MQHITDAGTQSILTKIKTMVSILVWAAGLILAGSDGPMMPYVNVLGAVLFAGSCLWLGRQVREPGRKGAKSQDRSRQNPPSGRQPHPEACGQARMTDDPSNCLGSLAIRPQYARELGVV